MTDFPHKERMVDWYKIIMSKHIGGREVVIGESTYTDTDRYLVAYCDSNDLLSYFSDGQTSDSYAEVVQEYYRRISDLAGKVLEEEKAAAEQGIELKPFEDYAPIERDDDIENKVVVIKPEILCPEYRSQIYQLALCTGGFGSHPNSRGNACYCTNLYTGEHSRYDRYDIAGTVPKDKLPEWAKRGLEAAQKKQVRKGGAR